MLFQDGTAAALPQIAQNLGKIVTAIGALGTAAYGLVDATKTLYGGGVNRFGFSKIKAVVESLTPGTPPQGLSQEKIIETLKSNWFNGTALSGQKAIAKTLIKQGLAPANAATLAALTGVDASVLTIVATKIQAGTTLLPDESDVYARFDFVLTALLDEVYQDADQRYTNWTKVVAMIFAVALAVVGGMTLFDPTTCTIGGHPSYRCYWFSSQMWEAFLVGVIATPLAPIAKDLSSALATAVNTLQTIKK